MSTSRSPKDRKLTEPMVVRWQRQGKRWNGHKCLLCGKAFRSEDCPHSIAENERVNQLLRDREGII